MKEITNCYANWRIDLIILLGILALLLITGETEALFIKAIGGVIVFIDFMLARYWHRIGKLPELDKITE